MAEGTEVGNPAGKKGFTPLLAGGLIAVAIAVLGLISMWTVALPVTPENMMCAAIYPPPAGCAGTARILPAAVWSALLVIATLVTLVLARRTWWGAVVGVTITGVVAFLGYWATLYVRLFLVV